MMSLLARADCLVVRAAARPAGQCGDWVEIIPLTGL